MSAIRQLIELMVNPYFICLFFLALSLVFLWRRTYLAFVRVTLLLVFGCLLVISTGWLPRYITYALESQYPVVTQIDPKIRWVVVLGGGQHQFEGMPANDLLTSESIKRLVEGVRLFHALPDAHLILSGGGSGSDQPEALLLAQLSKWFSIPEQRISLEQNSLNTADQARELGSFVHGQPFYLVTSAIHMPRSMALCQQQGLRPIAAPTDFTFFWSTHGLRKMIIPNPANLFYFSIAMHEVLGRIWASTHL